MKLTYKDFKTAIINMLKNLSRSIYIMKKVCISKKELNGTSRAEK